MSWNLYKKYGGKKFKKIGWVYIDTDMENSPSLLQGEEKQFDKKIYNMIPFSHYDSICEKAVYIFFPCIHTNFWMYSQNIHKKMIVCGVGGGSILDTTGP